MSQLAMLHRSVSGPRRYVLPHECVDQHTAERLVVRGSLGSVIVESQLRKYVMK